MKDFSWDWYNLDKKKGKGVTLAVVSKTIIMFYYIQYDEYRHKYKVCDYANVPHDPLILRLFQIPQDVHAQEHPDDGASQMGDIAHVTHVLHNDVVVYRVEYRHYAEEDQLHRRVAHFPPVLKKKNVLTAYIKKLAHSNLDLTRVSVQHAATSVVLQLSWKIV